MDSSDRQARLLRATRAVFAPRAGRELSDEDVRETTRNLSGFFRVLTDWTAELAGDGQTPTTAESMPASNPPPEPGNDR